MADGIPGSMSLPGATPFPVCIDGGPWKDSGPSLHCHGGRSQAEAEKSAFFIVSSVLEFYV